MRAHFVGIGGNIHGYQYRLIASHVDNYGTYKQPLMSNNTSFLLEINRHFKKLWGMDFSIALSGDFGTQYGNSFGAYLRIAKKGLITTY